jgi:hypothetical protein
MAKLNLISAAVMLSAIAAAPAVAQAQTYVRVHLPYPISYHHNYGPGLLPGTFAYYDGPSTIHCAQSAANYLGQDRRRYPCY